jgi:hypothetical protein
MQSHRQRRAYLSLSGSAFDLSDNEVTETNKE